VDCVDADSDGVSICGLDELIETYEDNDCDDTQILTYPGNTEVCDNYDNDCDGVIDEGCGTCGNSIIEAGE